MNKLSFPKKIFISLLLCISFLLLSCASVFSVLTSRAFTFSSYYGTNSAKVTNGDFTDYTKNTDHLPYKIDTGWTNITGLNSSTAYAGIVDTGANFDTNGKFTLSENPNVDESIDSPDDAILMIKAKSNDTKYGFVSNDISLDAGKYYVLNIHAKTINNATASIYTTLSSEANFTNVVTSGQWKTYSLYIATDTFNSSTFTVELRLGNKTTNSGGVAFFDQVEVLEVANIDYYNAQNEGEKVVNLNEDVITGFTNYDFENGLTGWEIANNSNTASVAKLSSINQSLKEFTGSEKNYADSFVYGNTSSLFILNKTNTSTKVSSLDTNTIAISQHGYYRLSMLVKTGNTTSGGLNVTLYDTQDESLTFSQTSITSTSGANAAFNNFKVVDFYIRGNVWKSSTLGLNFELGTSESEISGWAIIDNIILEKISESEYTSKKTETNACDLCKNVKEITAVKNGSFDFITSKQSVVSYPATPANWTGVNTDLSGVIRVRTEYFNNDCTSFGLISSQNPGPNTSYDAYEGIDLPANESYENVLMLRSTGSSNSFFKTSTAETISSNASSNNVIKYEVGVKTLNNAKAFISVVDSNDNVIAIYDNLSSPNWTKYTVFVKNGISSLNAHLVLGVHGGEENNYCFFDYAKYQGSLELELDEIKATQNSVYVDLLEDSFYSSSSEQIETNVYRASNLSDYALDSNKVSALYTGVISTSDFPALATRKDANDNNVLVISNNVASYQILQSNYKYSLSKDSYYEFSVWVNTDFEGCINEKDFGAYFEIVSLDDETNEIVINEKNKNKFTKIVAKDTNDNNGWVKYSIYVLAESSEDVKVLLGLGNTAYPTQGKVYFDDLKVASISKEDYAKVAVNDTTLVSKVIAASTSSDNNNDSNSSSTTPSDINFFALFSSIILVIALALAIAGYLIRRIPKKKIAKVEKSLYNKSPKEIDKKAVKQELKLSREEKIANLTKELADLKAERDTLQSEYEKATNNEESLSKQEQLYKHHTKKINKLNAQIDYIESALVYAQDEVNVRTMENLEIKKRQKEADEEFEKLKKQELEKALKNEEEKDSKSKNNSKK